MQERVRFIADYRSELYSMTELCERFGVSFGALSVGDAPPSTSPSCA